MPIRKPVPGQTLRDGYHYVSSSNPEDSTVTTSRYRLHSADRWIEDVLASNDTDTDIQNASFRNYYLDDAAPGPGDAQCGGDGKAFGSSGFGIVSNVPNTDPRNAPFNNLTVKRIRYFDAPGGGTRLAHRYADRVARPPAAKATTIR